jgi:hypothetical protein
MLERRFFWAVLECEMLLIEELNQCYFLALKEVNHIGRPVSRSPPDKGARLKWNNFSHNIYSDIWFLLAWMMLWIHSIHLQQEVCSFSFEMRSKMRVTIPRRPIASEIFWLIKALLILQIGRSPRERCSGSQVDMEVSSAGYVWKSFEAALKDGLARCSAKSVT